MPPAEPAVDPAASGRADQSCRAASCHDRDAPAITQNDVTWWNLSDESTIHLLNIQIHVYSTPHS